jgi:hypothetical protein
VGLRAGLDGCEKSRSLDSPVGSESLHLPRYSGSIYIYIYTQNAAFERIITDSEKQKCSENNLSHCHSSTDPTWTV